MTTHSRKVNPDERIDLIADYETYYDKDYSLRKLSPAEYILDPRFQIHGAGVTVGDLPITWVDGHALPEFFASVPWERTRFITHNALFDACILAWRFNVKPAQYCCTMSMAAARLRHITGKVSLDAVAQHLGEPPKLHTVQKLQGKTTEMIRADAALYGEMVEYGIDDTFKCRRIYNWMLRENAFPEAQLRIIDMIVRMAVEPQFIGNTQLLWEHLQQVMADKAALVQATGLDGRDSLMSDPKLAELLMALNVSPPVKKSKATGKPIWAFAKTDPEFNELLTNDDPRVQALAAARLGVKTTIEETRTQRFINIANLYWRNQNPQSIPIPLRYSGAHTHRFSGDWQMNAQNLGRQSKLRKALCAPDGRIVAAADSSQVEARGVATLAGQQDLIDQFASGEDVYCIFASIIYGRVITKADAQERQVGKVGILSLGYGASAATLQRMLRVNGIDMHIDGCQSIVDVYRKRAFPKIPQLWWYAQDLIPRMASDRECDAWLGPCHVVFRKIVLPSGLELYYDELRQTSEPETGRVEWVYGEGKRIYGAKLIENVTQAMCFGIIMDAALRIDDATLGHMPLAFQGHDELAYVVPERVGWEVAEFVASEMSRRPAYFPQIPLAAEYGVGKSYGDVVKNRKISY